MSSTKALPVLFLSYECPWPTIGGAKLRTWGLLKEISKVFDVELIILSQEPLLDEQIAILKTCSHTITRVPMRLSSIHDKLRIMGSMLVHQFPYHGALIKVSFQDCPDVLKRIQEYSGVVYASFGHWSTLICGKTAYNWVLDQHNADVDFWRIYVTEASRHRFLRIAAFLNWRLANIHFRRIYRRVGRIISVCEQDKQLTHALAPCAQVDVIENGIDCMHHSPHRISRKGPPQLLFTGTSELRNLLALRQFVHHILPIVQKELVDVELLVGGTFSVEAQAEFCLFHNIRFTGRVPDMRPAFDQSDVYIAPFQESYGSKLKVAEAMAMAIPIVATPQGVRGFPLVDGKSALIAYSNEQFAAHIIDLIRNPAQGERIGCAAREVALASIDWDVLGKRLIPLVKATFDFSQQVVHSQEMGTDVSINDTLHGV